MCPMRWLSILSGVLCLVSVLLWIPSYSTGDRLEVEYVREDHKVAPLLSVFTFHGGLFLTDERANPGRWTYDSVRFSSRKIYGPRSPLFLVHFQWRMPSTVIVEEADDYLCFTTTAPLWLFALVFMIGSAPWPLVALSRLRRRRAARCTQCGYDLTGNVSGSCPECGEALDSARRKWPHSKAVKKG